MDISALIITKNEEERIQECLESVKWVNEIIVIDSYSTDSTVDICKKYTSEVYQREFDNFASQKNFGLDKINSEWVLNIDADERVTSDLKSEIKDIIKHTHRSAFDIPIKTYFLNKPMKYAGEFPIYRTRLFKKDTHFYNKVHEDIEISQEEIGQLENPILHYTCLNLEHYINKYIHYAKLSAKQKYENGQKSNIAYASLRLFFDFFQKYILQKGFLMGGAGFIYSAIRAYYSFLKYVFLWEMNQNNK